MKKIVLLLSVFTITLSQNVLPQIFVEKGCMSDPLYVNEVADNLWLLLNHDSRWSYDFTSFKTNLAEKNLILIIVPDEGKACFIHARHKNEFTDELKKQMPLILKAESIASLMPHVIWDDSMNAIAETIFAVQKAWLERGESSV